MLRDSGSRRTTWGMIAVVIATSSTVGVGMAAGRSLGAAGSPCGITTVRPSTYAHVVVIVMENKTYGQVIGNAAAPYETLLANECGSATNYRTVSSPSRPNYIAMTSGGTHGCQGSDADPPNCQSTANNIFRQVAAAGGSAKSYVESMTTNCQTASSGLYATKHNPWPYYIGANDLADCRANDIPMGSNTAGALANDIGAGTLPTFSYVVPNLCNDMHDCSVAVGDAWLQTLVDTIITGPNYAAGNTAVIITYDEYSPLPNVFISPSVIAGSRYTRAANHYTLLRTIENALGLTFLRGAATAPTFRLAFNF